MTNHQWPNERESVNQQLSGNYTFDPKDGLRRLLDVCPSELPSAFDEAVEWIAQYGNDTSELERRMRDVSSELELTEIPENVNLLMAWACAEALAEMPLLQTWQNVRELKRHSWQLEHWLSDAMVVCLERKLKVRGAYIKLAKEVFEALDSLQLTSLSDRYNKEREQFRNAWDENPNKLEEIWWGLRWFHPMNYEEEFPLFKVLTSLDFSEFLAVVSRSKNPFLVNAALWSGGAFSEFSLWERLAVSAPVAFDDEGTWNSSVTMPLLLVTARDQLLQAGSHITHFNASDVEVEKLKQEIVSLAEAVVGTLNKRQDAPSLFARWSTWLMRQLLMQGLKDAENVRSSTFADATLIEAIGRELHGKTVNSVPPSDAPAWEAWCYRAVLASHANNGFIPVPDWKGFVEEWAINLDDWAGERGKQLRERASLIVTTIKGIPGDAAHSLAYAIAKSESPVDAWIALWNTTQTLREIVEFGDIDVSGADEYQSRGEASGLLLLVVCIGLSILDQHASQCQTGGTPQARALAKLHGALALAVREMQDIDDTLNREQWLQVVRHLAVRRLIWEDRTTVVRRNGVFPIFLPEDKPTFSDYLSAAKSDEMELLAVLQMTLLNESDRKIVQDKLHAASIDLVAVIENVKRLNAISDRKYPIDDSQLRAISEIAPTF